MANANIKAVITAEDRASKTLQGFGSGVESMGGKIAKSAKYAALALGAAAAAAVTFGIKSASNLQQARVAFETMLGSADKARKMMKRLSDFAVKTPFDLPQVVDGAKSLLAYGIAAENILPTFKALGSIAAGVGRDKLPQLTLAFGQVRAAGKLTGQELRQFTEAGVPLLEVLAKQSGKTAAEVKEAMENGAAPSFKEVEKAIFSMSQKGGKFYKLLEKQSKTLEGTFSNLKDVAVRSLSSLVGVSVEGEVRKGSIFYYLQLGAKNLLDYLTKNQGSFSKVGDNIIKSLKNGFIWFRDNVWPILERIKNGFMLVWNAGVQFLKPIIDELVKSFKENLLPVLDELWSKHGKEITQALTIIAGIIAGVLIGAIASLIIWVTVLTKAISFIVGLYTKWLDAQKKAYNQFKIGIQGIKDLIGWFTNLYNIVNQRSRGILNTIIGVFGRIYTLITNPFKFAADEVIHQIKRISGAMDVISGKKVIVPGVGSVTRKRSGGMVRARSGVMARVGEEGAENVILPSGSRVQRNIDTKLSGGGSTVNNFNFNVGMYFGTAVERRKAAEQIWKDLTDIASSRGTTPSKMMGM